MSLLSPASPLATFWMPRSTATPPAAVPTPRPLNSTAGDVVSLSAASLRGGAALHEFLREKLYTRLPLKQLLSHLDMPEQTMYLFQTSPHKADLHTSQRIADYIISLESHPLLQPLKQTLTQYRETNSREYNEKRLIHFVKTIALPTVFKTNVSTNETPIVIPFPETAEFLAFTLKTRGASDYSLFRPIFQQDRTPRFAMAANSAVGNRFLLTLEAYLKAKKMPTTQMKRILFDVLLKVRNESPHSFESNACLQYLLHKYNHYGSYRA